MSRCPTHKKVSFLVAACGKLLNVETKPVSSVLDCPAVENSGDPYPATRPSFVPLVPGQIGILWDEAKCLKTNVGRPGVPVLSRLSRGVLRLKKTEGRNQKSEGRPDSVS